MVNCSGMHISLNLNNYTMRKCDCEYFSMGTRILIPLSQVIFWNVSSSEVEDFLMKSTFGEISLFIENATFTDHAISKNVVSNWLLTESSSGRSHSYNSQLIRLLTMSQRFVSIL